ncbi:cell wall hydrolase [Oscillospiraceae bacterium 50-58]|jgi:hypothetical protein|nr:cell wall hydrolase [Oscillospiraceae bacterium]
MNETKFEPFIKGFMVLVVICAVIYAIAFASKEEAILKEAIQDSTVCETLTLSAPPEITRAVETRTMVPATPPIQSVPEEEAPNPYAELVITAAEKELLACMVYNEARGEPFEGQIAVVQVALNRYMHEAFDGSISDILLAPNQFSVGNTYGEEQMEAVEAALAGEPVLELNTDVVFFSTGKLTYGSYYKTIGGHVFRTYF